MEAAEVTDTERCRCCMASGTPGKDLSDQYDWMGEKEVYADMLLESFDVTLSQTVDAGWKICDACVVRLRDSANFKKQVLSSEQNLLLRLGGAHESTSKNVAVELKVEKMKAETAGSEEDDLPEFETHFYDDEDELKDSSPVKFEARPSTSNTEMSNDEDVPLSALSGTKRKAPRAEAAQAKFPKLTVKTTKTAKVAAKPKVTAKPVVRTDVKLALQAAASKANAAKKQSAQTLLSKLSARPIKITVKSSKTSVAKKGDNRKENASTLIECSTVVPFKWSHKHGLFCFYCGEPFRDITTLKQHTMSEDYRSARSIIRRMLQEFSIKVDVASIQCRLCHVPLADLDTLKKHLTSEHRKSFSEEAGDGVLPFKLENNNFSCLVCAESFNSFRMLYKHANVHFGSYPCPKCDRKCLSSKKLGIHLNFHKSVECPYCELTFNTELKVKTHIARAHSDIVPPLNAYKCPVCPETFKYDYIKNKHLIKVHNETSLQHHCLACGKAFFRKSHLTQHTRKVHMMERDYECDICKKRFWSKGDLSEHMVSHGAKKMHHCEECKMSFVQRKSLKHHILRKHKEEKNLVCLLCGKAFLLPAELRCHMRTRKHQDMLPA